MVRWKTTSLLFAAGLVAAAACGKRVDRSLVEPEALATVDSKSPFLKAHMKDGSLYVLSEWAVHPVTSDVSGSGLLYEADRSQSDSGRHYVPLDSVALFETNVVHASSGVAALAIISGISVGFTVYCATNPKACFGSCPTFYVSDGHSDLLQAEGFSASVAPSLEATDIDALYRARGSGSRFTLRMTNEALETHVVRTVNLLAVRREPGRRVLVDEESVFWSVDEPEAPVSCAAEEGDCLALVRAFDQRERFSAADSADLAARELLELTFSPRPGESTALVLASRQSLLPTYVLYQALAYMGSSVGEWLAKFERADSATQRRAGDLVSTLGGIDVLVLGPDGTWTPVGAVMETGPLAADVRLVHLPPLSDSIRVRLRMARGAWRVDYVALVSPAQRIEPVRLSPTSVLGPDAAARSKLLDSTQVLVTLPGDEYRISYDLPGETEEYELFLESRGYYLEWMRQEWIAEEDKWKAMRLFRNPAFSLRRLAPEFKEVEPMMEAAFWGSKYVAP